MAKKILVSYDFTNLEILNFKFQNLATDPGTITGKPYYNTVTNKVLFGNSTGYYDPTDRQQHTGVQTIGTITGLQTALDGKTSPADVNDAIAAVVGAAPEALNTLVEIANQLATDESAVASLITTVGTKADASDTTAALALKANITDVTASLALKADTSTVTAALAGKADATETETALAGKAAISHTHIIADVIGLQTALDSKSSVTSVTDALALKANVTDVPAKYAVTIGGATSFDITHNLGTFDVVVQAYEISTGSTIECDITRTSTTHITAAFSVAPPAASIRIIVHG